MTLRRLSDAVRAAELVARCGRVSAIRGQSVEGRGPSAQLGEVCWIERGPLSPVEAEVLGFRDGRTLLMPSAELAGVPIGARIVASGRVCDVPVGRALLGRVVDAFGRPVDDKGPMPVNERRHLQATPPAALQRTRVTEPLETGIRVIDTMLTLAKGQRIGLFAGSGVGKSTLMGSIARGTNASINVVALIGERSREVREFVEDNIGIEALARTVVVVATSSDPAVVRVKAAYAAMTIAEWFRDAGEDVLLLMDSLTRFAMARREVGLAVGEPPTARGYTPSVFGELPQLCERSGPGLRGSITAVYTVLVDGDDFNEPISDAVRGILDGHLVLSRDIANAGRYPAIDVLRSVSRVYSTVNDPIDCRAARAVIASCALYERNRQLIDIGAYKPGVNDVLDRAVKAAPHIEAMFAQGPRTHVERARGLLELRQLASIVGDGP